VGDGKKEKDCNLAVKGGRGPEKRACRKGVPGSRQGEKWRDETPGSEDQKKKRSERGRHKSNYCLGRTPGKSTLNEVLLK